MITLTATTEDGTSETATETIDIDEPDPKIIKPHVEYSPEYPTANESVVLDAGETTVENAAVDSYEWDLTDDGSTDVTGEVVTTELEAGTHSVELTVEAELDSGESTSATTTQVIDVASPKITPDIEVSPANPRVGEDVTFDASGSTVDGSDEIVAYEWDLSGSDSVDTSGQLAVERFDEGTHAISLTLRSDAGLEQSIETTIEVAPERANIQITATDTELSVNESTAIEYSVTNFITSEELTVQLILEKPNDVAVTDITNARGTNQFTAVATVPPGQQQPISIRLEPNTAQSFVINAIADYYVGDDQSDAERVSESLQFDVEVSAPRSDESPPDDSTDDESPGFGVPTAISSLGGLSYLLHRRNQLAESTDDKISD